MPGVAASRGVAVTVLDGGGQQTLETDPLRPRGPLANSLDGRLTGSAQEIDARGDAAASAPGLLGERTEGDLLGASDVLAHTTGEDGELPA